MVPGYRQYKKLLQTVQSPESKKIELATVKFDQRERIEGPASATVNALILTEQAGADVSAGDRKRLPLAKLEANDMLLGASGKLLAALDLTVSPQALRVPAMKLPAKRLAMKWSDLLRPAILYNNAFLKDTYGQRYDLRAPFMHGSYGSVRLALKSDPVVSQYYVAKEIKLTGPDGQDDPRQILKSIRSEVSAAIRAGSPLAPHAVLQTDVSIFLLMPVITGDMFMLLEAILDPAQNSAFYGANGGAKRKQAQESLAAVSMMAAARGVLPLHQAGWAHRDIKPENVFFDRSGEAMLADFGLVEREIPNGEDVSGTIDYQPFEALLAARDRHPETPYSAIKSDIWGAGAMALFMLVERTPTDQVGRLVEQGGNSRALRNTVLDHQFDYRAAWLKHSALILGGEKGPLLAPDTNTEGAYLRMFSKAKIASPRLFPVLLKALHPLPAKRPQADELFQQVRAAMGNDLLSLKAIIHCAQISSQQHWTPDRHIEQQLNLIAAAKTQRLKRSHRQRLENIKSGAIRAGGKSVLLSIAEQDPSVADV